MRLMCPNCDAEYSVDDAAIPPSGRDVQCSNCGHAWFQLHPDAEREAETLAALFAEAPATGPGRAETPPVPGGPAPEAAVAEAPVLETPDPEATVANAPPVLDPAPEPEVADLPYPEAPLPPEVTPAQAPVSAAPVAAAPQDGVDSDADGTDGSTVVQLHPTATPQPRTLDENLLSILREEAARETAVRRAEAPGMPEVQTDLGLTAALPASSAATAPEPAVTADTAPVTDLDVMEATNGMGDRAAPRRNLLPNIEEINSTLRAGSEARGADAEALVLAEKARTRGGFRAGFVVTLIIAVLLTAAYTMAPRIAEHLPGSAPVMASYVHSVDVARVWLDDTMKQAVGALRGLTGETP